MEIHVLSGFLGSGKTTAIAEACRYLMGIGKSVGVITNDQGTELVDGGLFEHQNIASRQVTGGCFCCNYTALESSIASLVELNRPDVIFAESVGSCTDIIATVIKPLLKFTPYQSVHFSTFADVRLLHMLLSGETKGTGEAKTTGFHGSVSYIYFKQLEEASIITVTKVDLASKELLAEVKGFMEERYPEKTVIYQNSNDPAAIKNWLQISAGQLSAAGSKPLSIDYQIYGEGEAKLAWFDQELDIHSTQDAYGNALELVTAIGNRLMELHYPIGHLKFLVDGAMKISVTATTDWKSQKMRLKQLAARLNPEKKSFARLLINARVQTAPETLFGLIREVTLGMEADLGCVVVPTSTASFQPGFPRPKYRMLD